MERKHYIIMLVAVAILFAIPFLLGGTFEGADVSGGAALEEMGVTPWFNPIWEPPSGEVETGFFAIQAAIGAIIVGYILGYYAGINKGKKRKETDKDSTKSSK